MVFLNSLVDTSMVLVTEDKNTQEQKPFTSYVLLTKDNKYKFRLEECFELAIKKNMRYIALQKMYGDTKFLCYGGITPVDNVKYLSDHAVSYVGCFKTGTRESELTNAPWMSLKKFHGKNKQGKEQLWKNMLNSGNDKSKIFGDEGKVDLLTCKEGAISQGASSFLLDKDGLCKFTALENYDKMLGGQMTDDEIASNKGSLNPYCEGEGEQWTGKNGAVSIYNIKGPKVGEEKGIKFGIDPKTFCLYELKLPSDYNTNVGYAGYVDEHDILHQYPFELVNFNNSNEYHKYNTKIDSFTSYENVRFSDDNKEISSFDDQKFLANENCFFTRM